MTGNKKKREGELMQSDLRRCQDHAIASVISESSKIPNDTKIYYPDAKIKVMRDDYGLSSPPRKILCISHHFQKPSPFSIFVSLTFRSRRYSLHEQRHEDLVAESFE